MAGVSEGLFAIPAPSPEPAKTEPSPHAANDAAAATLPKEDAPPASQPKAIGEGLDPENDPNDTSSLSGKFFLDEPADDPSLSPVVDEPQEPSFDHDDGDDEQPIFLSPEAQAHRARLRRIVGGLVAFVGLIAIAVVGKAVLGSSKSSAPSPSASATASVAPAVPKPAETVAPKPAETMAATAAPAAPSAAPSADSAKPADSATADAQPAPSGEPDAKPAEAAPDPAKAAALEKEALSLLNRGKRKEAIEKAREAIAADPSQAMPYLYLGSALQDSGRWKDGIEAYSECVRNATKGPVNECRAMGGRK